MDWLIERLDEPSTYAGLSGLAVSLGISAPLYSAVTTVVAAVFGLLAVLKHEKKA